jgi:hypothetical protein
MNGWCAVSLIAAAAVGCRLSLGAAGDAIDLPKARAFSDTLVALIIDDKPEDIWQKMEARFRRDVAKAQIRPMLDQVYAQYGGRPLEAEFKSESSGQKVYLDGTTKPMRKFWYAVRTDTHAKGEYFLFVEVVPDEGRLACTGFSIVSFPGGAPPEFR